MNALGLFIFGTLLLSILAALAIFNFERYRFVHDKTLLIIALFVACFMVNIFFILTLIDYSALT